MEHNFFGFPPLCCAPCHAAFNLPNFLNFLPAPSSSSMAPLETKNLINTLEGGEGDTSGLDLSLSLKPPGTATKKCSLCGTTETPHWRSSCCGKKALCNGCGLEVRNKAKKSAAKKESTRVKRKYKRRLTIPGTNN